MHKILRSVAALLAGAMALTACSSNGSDGHGDTATPTTMEKLRIVLPTESPMAAGTIGLGIAEGIFKKAGVDVDLQIIPGAAASNSMVAGQADITEGAPLTATNLAGQGKDASVIWAAAGGGMGLHAFSNIKGPANLTEFKSKLAGNCKIGVNGPGSLDLTYSNLLNKVAGWGCKTVTLGDTQSILAALIAGRVDILFGVPQPDTANAVKAGKIQDMLNFADPEFKALGLPEYPEYVLYGLRDNLHSKRTAVERFVAGMKTAADLYQTMDSGQIADKLLTIEAVKKKYPLADDRTVLASSVEGSKPFVNWKSGNITSAQWATYLDTMGGLGLSNFDPKDPKRSYENIVDMSYFSAAAKK